MKATAAVATWAWVASGVPEWRAFRRALENPDRSQERVLRRIVAAAADSEFGRAHDFGALRTVADFQRAVPPGDYDSHAPWIERVAAGEPGVLTGAGPRDRVTRFEPSSGSSASRKLIPSTARSRRQFQRAIAAWVVQLYRERPALAGGPAYWSISPAIASERTPGGLPVGFESDSAYLGGLGRRFVELAMAVPGEVASLEAADFRRATLGALLRCRELRLISVWNPSFWTLLVAELRRDWTRLLRELGDGVVIGGSRLPAAPRRAREVAGAGPDDLRALWPHLGLVSCWTEAHAASAVPALLETLPGVPVQPKGLVATEGFVTLPFRGANVLALRSHFLEIEADDGSIRPATELEVGEEGGVLLTTGAGLYRYRLGDRVRVSGRMGATPTLAFLGRQDRVADLRGEKLSEAFVGRVLRELQPEGFSMLAPVNGSPPHYRLYASASATGELARQAHARLCENPHYRWCVELGQLAPVELSRVTGDPDAAWLEACSQGGQRLGDIKPAALVQDPALSLRFEAALARQASP